MKKMPGAGQAKAITEHRFSKLFKRRQQKAERSQRKEIRTQTLAFAGLSAGKQISVLLFPVPAIVGPHKLT
jgi:hypothetical protein